MSVNNKSEGRVPEAARYEYPENASDVPIGVKATSNVVTGDAPKKKKKKITIEVDEDDPCLKEAERAEAGVKDIIIPGSDPRFQQQNQTVRCWVMYTDFYRCEKILGEGSEACTWFKQVFTSLCPNDWIVYWDKLRSEGRFGWHKKQGKFPGDKYGV